MYAHVAGVSIVGLIYEGYSVVQLQNALDLGHRDRSRRRPTQPVIEQAVIPLPLVAPPQPPHRARTNAQHVGLALDLTGVRSALSSTQPRPSPESNSWCSVVRKALSGVEVGTPTSVESSSALVESCPMGASTARDPPYTVRTPVLRSKRTGCSAGRT